MLKEKVVTLNNSIIQNLDFISKEYEDIDNVLNDLEHIVRNDMQHSLIFQWWSENENEIDIIYKILQRKETNENFNH